MLREMVRPFSRRTTRRANPSQNTLSRVSPASRTATRLAVAVVLTLLAGSSAVGQEWIDKMIDHTSHNFGTVARGAKIEHTFTIENIYEEDIVITDVYSSCGCTVPTVDKYRLKTWEKAHIVASLDTRSFYGQKEAVLTVVFGGQFPGEARLYVHSTIRADVVFQPGSVEFGSVAEGAGATKKVDVIYAGQSNWQVLRVESPNPHIVAKAAKKDTGPNGQLTYEVDVTLKPDAPPGYLRDYLTLVTNDPNEQSARVPLAVEGVVASAVTARPSPLLLGVVPSGGAVTRQLVVQGQAPFRITGIEASDPRLACPLPEGEKTVHLLPVTLSAGEEPGDVNGSLTIQTSATPDKPLEVPVNGRVTAATPAPAP